MTNFEYLASTFEDIVVNPASAPFLIIMAASVLCAWSDIMALVFIYK